MVTEQQLRNLNDKVYAVDPNYKKDGKPVKILKGGEKIKTDDGQEFEVLSAENGDHGFQGMGVAPIVNGEIDYSQVTVVACWYLSKRWQGFEISCKRAVAKWFFSSRCCFAVCGRTY